MSDVIQFVSRAELDAKANLAAFINLAKERLTAFGAGGAWDSNRWEHDEVVAVFATKTMPLTSYSYTPMAEPFMQFAKSYLRYSFSHAPVKSVAYMLQALRCVEAGLLASGEADIRRLTAAIMDVSAEKCREFYRSDDLLCNTGRQLQKLFDFVREHQFVPGLPMWRSPFKKPKILTEDLGAAGRAHRESKLPSNATMLALADLFAQADDPESQYFSSILILLMATPSRISEVLVLPVDCIQWEPDDAGVPQMYLQWHAAKGAGATKKWIVPAMQDVVQEAVRRLIEIGAPARVAARFAFDHPGEFMPHAECLIAPSDAGDRPLLPDEFCAAVGLKCPGGGRLRDGTPTWVGIKGDKQLKPLIRTGATGYRDLAAYVLETFRTRHWPHIDEGRAVLAWEALCLHRVNEFHRDFAVKPFSWRLATTNEVNTRFETRVGRSLFDRRGFKNPDGSSIKLTTHQPRHWLSTMSERAGMDDYTLAQWAGRAKVTDNRHYDHRTEEERLEVARDILQVQQPPLLERFKARQPVTYEDLGVDRLGAAKATLYGMCVHDYAMAPCQKQRECMTCKEHVCIKGDHITLERIRILEAQTEGLLHRAQLAHEEGDFGADRWVDNHKWKLAHVKAMRMSLEHPLIPDGAVLRIPDGHDPSPVRRTLMELGMDERPQIEGISLPAIPLALV